MEALAISSGETILIVSLLAVPVAAASFAVGARNALRQIGRGPLSIDEDPPARPDPAGGQDGAAPPSGEAGTPSPGQQSPGGAPSGRTDNPTGG